MPPNNKAPVTPGIVRALTNKWQAGQPSSNSQQVNLSLLDALPDRNCSLSAQSAPAPALAIAINRWERRATPTPAQQALHIFNVLPDGGVSLVPQSFRSNAVVRAPPRLTGFRFPDLPPELRAMIWELCIPGPQIIRVTDNAMRHNRSHSRQNPAVLHVNSESRAEALKQLTRLFGGVNCNGHPEQFKYFNPTLDLVYFDGASNRIFVFPPTILPPVADLTDEAPLVQGDNVIFLQLDEDQINQAGPAAFFKNVECVRVQYNNSRSSGDMFTPAYAPNAAGSQLFVQDINLQMLWDTDIISRWYRARINSGLVSRMPRIEILLTRVDQRLVDSAGQYAIDYFRDNPIYG
ncbi:hypothetical protein BOTCAL_0650g00030 [Botryotinia calthae]|uniref:2EXR domain-containing protein n=1 Tax=Botryotinia calthae TaxID=38488 RepID=A0A4Y8CKL3_9HELO|nr:hypothetical protein BOTCAL_0650g00030 [Botryotinia calthae]